MSKKPCCWILMQPLSAVVQGTQTVTVFRTEWELSSLHTSPCLFPSLSSALSCSGNGGDHCRHTEGGGFPSDSSRAGPGRLVLRVQQPRRPRPPKDVYRRPGRAVVSATSSSGGELQQFLTSDNCFVYFDSLSGKNVLLTLRNVLLPLRGQIFINKSQIS